MLVTIERSRIDPYKLYGRIVAEGDYLIALQREIDFQFDGFIFIRKRDVTKRIEGTESQRYMTLYNAKRRCLENTLKIHQGPTAW